MNKKLDVNATTSELKGIAGFLETLLRKFRDLAFLVALSPMALLYVFCMGVALTPGVMMFHYASEQTATMHYFARGIILGQVMALGFFCYGLSLIFVVPLVNKLLFLKVVPQRTTWFSLSVIPWYIHNSLIYLVRYTFIDLITPTPLNKLFYQMMGMKIGKGTVINTSNISDACLIEIGDYVTIGGSCTLVAHYGMKGFLVIDRLIIKDRATIGLRANLFGDVVVGVGATVKPNEVVYPKTRIPDVIETEKATD